MKERSVVSKAHLSLLPSQICLPCGPSQGPGSVEVSPSVCHLPGTEEGNKQRFNEMYLTSLKEQSIIYLKQNGFHTLTSVLNIQAFFANSFISPQFRIFTRIQICADTPHTCDHLEILINGLMTQVWDH